MTLEMTDDEFRLFRDFIHKECGLHFVNGNNILMLARLVYLLSYIMFKCLFWYYV
jgi:hypothetical protein